MAHEDVHTLISGTYACVTLHDNGDLRLQMESRVLISWP